MEIMIGIPGRASRLWPPQDTPLFEEFGIQDEINRSLKSKVCGAGLQARVPRPINSPGY
jgi:hypothetical protein